MPSSPLISLRRAAWPILLALVFLLPAAGRAQGNPPRIVESTAESRFPDAVVFRLTAEADAPIEKIWLYYAMQGDISTTRQAVAFTPSRQVSAEYTWDTSRITVPPSSPVLFYWEVRDAEGNLTRSEETVFRYDDSRFEWQELRQDDLVVRWYEGDAAFGQSLFETARQALNRMEQESGRPLDFSVYLVVYPNREDFASWHSYVEEWVGGQAFPPLGVTVEIIAPGDPTDWVQDVIPHEIAHLFFYQAVHGATADWPRWLDEGVAQYYEPGDHARDLALVSAAAKEGNLIPLEILSGSFGSDTGKVYLAYAESLSAVLYMRETWDEASFAAFVAALREGAHLRDAMQTAFGVTWEEFVAGWLTWLGTPATPAPPPTPTPTYVYPTAPSWYTPTPRGETAGLAASPSPEPSSTPRPAVTATPSPEETVPLGGGVTIGAALLFWGCILCGGSLFLLLGAGILFWRWRIRHR